MPDDPRLSKSLPFWTQMVIDRYRNAFLHARKRITTLTDDEIHAILERAPPGNEGAQDKFVLEEMMLADDDKPKSPRH